MAQSPIPVEPRRPIPVEPPRPIPVDMPRGMKKGGMAESKAMVGKEVAFMKKKGAPAKMVKHEMAEMKGMKKGGSIDGCAQRGKTRLKRGGSC
jgi:hypothetical protein